MYTNLIFFVAVLLLTKFPSETKSVEVVVSTTPRHSQIDDCAAQIANLQKTVYTNSEQLKVLLSLMTKKFLDEKQHNGDFQGCREVQERGYNFSNFYYIKPPLAPQPFLVLCDMKTREGGWTYILNRFDGTQNFNLNWSEYKHGFGKIRGEFWLGLDKLHYLTGYKIHELLVELEDWNSKKVYALYNSFSVGSEDEGYVIKLLEGYSGDAGESFIYHYGKKFSTKDKDQDDTSGNCAAQKDAGWWYGFCTESLLTGKYYQKNQKTNSDGIYWTSYKGYEYSFKKARMMIRQRNNDKAIRMPHPK